MSLQLDGNSNGAVTQENRNGTVSGTQYGNGTCEDSRVLEDIRPIAMTTPTPQPQPISLRRLPNLTVITATM